MDALILEYALKPEKYDNEPVSSLPPGHSVYQGRFSFQVSSVIHGWMVSSLLRCPMFWLFWSTAEARLDLF